MVQFAIAPKQVNSLLYTGATLYFVPCVEFERAPTTTDRAYPILCLWRNKNQAATAPDAYGDVWILVKFLYNSGTRALDAIWIKFASENSDFPILSVLPDSGAAIVPDALGQIQVKGVAVVAGSNPVRTVNVGANAIQTQVQLASAPISSSALNAGLCSFSPEDFDVDANGYVTIVESAPVIGGKNLGISYSGGTFSVCAQDGTALSATNPGSVTFQNKSIPGQLITVQVTANQTFIDDSGASTIAGNLFGFASPDTTPANDVPFFIYAVMNDAMNAISFMISRSTGRSISPAAANIGKTGSPLASTAWSYFALGNPTVADYDQNPCTIIGSFRMRLTTAPGDWTVQSLTISDGVGQFQDDVLFSIPPGVMGASANTHWLTNTGTAPVFTTRELTYSIDLNGIVNIIYFGDVVTTNGVGAVSARLIMPFPHKYPNNNPIVAGSGRHYLLSGVNVVITSFPKTLGYSDFAYSDAVAGTAATLLNTDITIAGTSQFTAQFIFNIATQ